MNNTSEDNNIHMGRLFAFLFIWIITTVISMLAGHIGGYVAGMRPGGWNIHMIYPPLYGGIIGLISYPIFRFSLRIGSKNKDTGLFSGMLLSVILAFGMTSLIMNSAG
jgi:hypothetical protein